MGLFSKIIINQSARNHAVSRTCHIRCYLASQRSLVMIGDGVSTSPRALPFGVGGCQPMERDNHISCCQESVYLQAWVSLLYRMLTKQKCFLQQHITTTLEIIATKPSYGNSNILLHRFRYLVAINIYLLQWW